MNTCVFRFPALVRLAALILVLIFSSPVKTRAQTASAPETSATLVLTPMTSVTLFRLQTTASDVRIGDPVRLELRSISGRIGGDRIEEVAFVNPPDPDKWVAEGAWRREFQTQKDGQPGPWRLVMHPFDTGALEIPALTVTYRDDTDARQTTQVPAGLLHVRSVRPSTGSGQEALIGLRGPAAIPADWSWIGEALGVLLGCAIVGALIMRWWSRRGLAPAVPEEEQLPPGLWALRELDLRSQLPVCQTGPPKVIFTLASEVIRLYLGRRYGIAAIDMTTLETLQALQPIVPAGDVLRWLQQFLEECDMVKFTKYEPPRGRWTAVWDDARLIVKLTTTNEELGGAADDRREARAS